MDSTLGRGLTDTLSRVSIPSFQPCIDYPKISTINYPLSAINYPSLSIIYIRLLLEKDNISACFFLFLLTNFAFACLLNLYQKKFSNTCISQIFTVPLRRKLINMCTFLGIIPARYASTPFPGKPLGDIGGKPMIQRVYEQAKKALTQVVVATDDQRIFDAVREFGGEVYMTRTDHKCGTDRCLEAYQKWCSAHNEQPGKEHIIINIQGDEPFIQPSQIEAIKSCFPTEIATLVKPYTTEDSLADLENPNTPKVVFSEVDHHAVLFSRSVIPYLRGIDKQDWLAQGKHYRHIGMYAYRADILAKITQLPQSPMEKAESLEQLRWLENGYQIRVAVCETYSMGIDTPDDLAQAIAYLSQHTE